MKLITIVEPDETDNAIESPRPLLQTQNENLETDDKKEPGFKIDLKPADESENMFDKRKPAEVPPAEELFPKRIYSEDLTQSAQFDEFKLVFCLSI